MYHYRCHCNGSPDKMDVCAPYVRVPPNHRKNHDRCHFCGFAVQMGVCALYVRVPPNHRMYHYRCHFNGFPDKMDLCAPYVRVPPNHRMNHYRCHVNGFPDRMSMCAPKIKKNELQSVTRIPRIAERCWLIGGTDMHHRPVHRSSTSPMYDGILTETPS